MCKLSLGHIAQLQSKEAASLQRCIGPCKQGAVTMPFASSQARLLSLASFAKPTSFYLMLKYWCKYGSVLGPGLWSRFTLTLGYFSDPHRFSNHLLSDAFQMHISPAHIPPKPRPKLAAAYLALPPACLMGTSNPECRNSPSAHITHHLPSSQTWFFSIIITSVSGIIYTVLINRKL